MAIFTALISSVWSLFDISYPGFPFTFGQAFLGFLIVGVAVSFLKRIGIGGGSGYRSGSRRNTKTSKEREHDEK